MNDRQAVATVNQRQLWVRALYMVVMAFAYHASGMVLFLVAIIQFVMTLVTNAPNVRLVAFGRSLGRYFQQIVSFLTFASDDVPFPFKDWPSGD